MTANLGPDLTEAVHHEEQLKGYVGPSKIVGGGWHVCWPDRSNGSLAQSWPTRTEAIEYLRGLRVPAERSVAC